MPLRERFLGCCPLRFCLVSGDPTEPHTGLREPVGEFIEQVELVREQQHRIGRVLLHYLEGFLHERYVTTCCLCLLMPAQAVADPISLLIGLCSSL